MHEYLTLHIIQPRLTQPIRRLSDVFASNYGLLYGLVSPQTSENRLTAPPSVAARPAILSSRDRSIAGYS